MKFALITADSSHNNFFTINPETGDATSFLNWISIWKGLHLSFEKLREEGYNQLKNFDIVMMSGHPHYIKDLIEIANFLKDSKTLTMFYPEGSTQLYDNSINGFHKEYYEAWNSCDILSIAEEDKLSYYKSFIRTNTIVKFIHVPMRFEMETGYFLKPFNEKENFIIVYGDNNSNHPLIALSCANKLNKTVYFVEGKDQDISSIFPKLSICHIYKLGLYPFLRLMARSILHFYPTDWIGTAREQITCAVTGTPCIGNKESHTQNRLFPDLAVNIYDIDSMLLKAEKLLNDSSYYKKVTETAFKNVEFYSIESTCKRFIAACEEAYKIKEKVMIPI